MPYTRCLVVAILALLAACGGSSDPASSPSAGISDVGSLTVILDTRAGDDAWVQFQLAGVTLERPGGEQTANLLRESRMLTFGDPSGEAAGVRLDWAPLGSYDALHLVLVPGSGVVVDASGNRLTVTSPVDIRIPITDGFEHSPISANWLLVGHDIPPLRILGATATWFPRMSARLDGAEVSLDPLAVPVVRGDEIAVTATLAQDSTLMVDPSPSCVYRDEDGTTYPSRDDFLAALDVTDDLCVVGDLERKGILDADIICRKPGNGESRLIGRVVGIDSANQRFKFQIQAVNPFGRGVELPPAREVWVRTDHARIQAPNGTNLPFGVLAFGDLAKVRWSSIEEVPNGLDVVDATEVVIPGGNSGQHQPLWQARVVGVDLTLGFLEIEPRNQPIRLLGIAVPAATVLVVNGTRIERQGPGGRQLITLAEVQPGVDRVWVRGVVVGPATIEASRVRVKEE